MATSSKLGKHLGRTICPNYLPYPSPYKRHRHPHPPHFTILTLHPLPPHPSPPSPFSRPSTTHLPHHPTIRPQWRYALGRGFRLRRFARVQRSPHLQASGLGAHVVVQIWCNDLKISFNVHVFVVLSGNALDDIDTSSVSSLVQTFVACVN